jgi:hypothetical protein
VDIDRPGRERFRVLVLGCSRRQRPDLRPLPAIQRYDGPSFRVLRRYFRNVTGAEQGMVVMVLSAEHGLIPGELPILPYNRTMTTERARELAPNVMHHLTAALATALLAHPTGPTCLPSPADLLIACTSSYLPALPVLPSLAAVLPSGSRIRIAPLRPGERLACLHDWLYGRPAQQGSGASSIRDPRPSDDPVKLQLRGARATLSATGLLAQAQAALADETQPAPEAVSWAVNVDGLSVPPKWLVSIGFGLPRSAFGTSDALRVLATLGIAVRRLPV